MHKLLIVDDNEMDRNGIMRHLPFDRLGITAISADSGLSGLETARKEKPEIVLTDISMPDMTGIEMAKIILEESPDTHIIFMSCYDDFSFAQSGIKLGITDYILKPIELDTLINAIENATKKLEEKKKYEKSIDNYKEQLRKNKSLIEERFFTQCLFTSSANDTGIFQISPDDINISGGFKFAMILSSSSNSDMVNSFANQLLLKKLTKDMFPENATPYLINCDLQVSVLIIQDDLISLNTLIETLENLQESFYLSCGEKASVCLFSYPVDITQFHKSFQYLLQLAKTERFSREDSFTVCSDLILDMPSLSLRTETDISMQLKKLLDNADSSGVDTFIENLFKSNQPINEVYTKALCFYVVNTINIYLIENHESFTSIIGNELSVWEKLVNFNTIHDAKQWLKNMLEFTISYIRNQNESKNISLVEKMKDRIDKSYSTLLSLNQIVDNLYVSPNYANKLFHEQYGITLYDYLQNVRVNEAMRLLTTTNLKHSEIAEKVGYQSSTYFTTAFKKHVGLSPKEYRRIKSNTFFGGDDN